MLEMRWEGQRGRDGGQLNVGRLVSSIDSLAWAELNTVILRPSSKGQVIYLVSIVQSRIAHGHPLGHVRLPSGWLSRCEAEAKVLRQLVQKVDEFDDDARDIYDDDYDDTDSYSSSYADRDEIELDIQLDWDHHEPAWQDDDWDHDANF
jgi:hypothetical protein